jgi:hypothetical protein
VDEERLSRWAAGITGGFFAVLLAAIVVFARLWDCAGTCKRDSGGAIVLAGVVALILAPVSALALHLAHRIAARPLANAVHSLAGLVLVAAIGAWAGAAGALVSDAKGWVAIANSIALALVMAVYCAAVAGGSWMAAIGLSRLEREG